MSLNTEGLSAADIAAVTGNNNSAWGGDFGSWIILFLIFGLFGGWGGRGFGGSAGAAENYVLASDFSQLSRQIDSGFAGVERRTDSIINGLCDGFYTQAQLINGTNTAIMQGNNAISAQLAQCCCDIREGISGVNYNMAMNANATQRAIENGFAQTNYNMATQNCATLTAIDKVGDRVIDYLANKEMAALQRENDSLRLAASQAKQNEYLVSQLGYQCPKPAYVVQPPQQVTFPTNCGGVASYGNFGGCGCG
jgi:hypothetical protein